MKAHCSVSAEWSPRRSSRFQTFHTQVHYVAVSRVHRNTWNEWPIQYFQHTEGSRLTVEHCGDQQHKSNSLKNQLFRSFIGSLLITLQIALPLLARGPSQYSQSVGTSAHASRYHSLTSVSSSSIGIVAARTSSYGCLFQTNVFSPRKQVGLHLQCNVRPSRLVF